MTPTDKLMRYGYCKWGARTLTGWRVNFTVRDLHELKGKDKESQMRFICGFFGLDSDWVESKTWTVTKSRNLRYHPATYTLEVSG